MNSQFPSIWTNRKKPSKPNLVDECRIRPRMETLFIKSRNKFPWLTAFVVWHWTETSAESFLRQTFAESQRNQFLAKPSNCLPAYAVISDPVSRCPQSSDIILKFNFIPKTSAHIWRPRYQFSFANMPKTITSQALSSSWPHSRPVKSKLFSTKGHSIAADRTSQLFLASSENRRLFISQTSKHVKREGILNAST